MARSASGIPPWHMWGSSQQITVVGVPAVGTTSEFVQLVDVKYRRPESWRFYLAATIDRISAPPLPVSVQVQYTFQFGLGRSQIIDANFETLEFAVAAPVGAVLISAEAQRPAQNTARTAPNLVSLFPAQDIQVKARVSTNGSINAGNVLSITVHAYVAPATHVRPEWFSERFPAAEDR